MPKQWIPRRFGEHKAHKHLRRLADANLQKGDILIAKEWSNTDSDVRFIRAGQAVFSHVRGGSSQSEHVLLNCAEGKVYVIESLGDGLNIGNSVRRRDHVVYSCTDNALRLEACKVAKVLAGVKGIQRIHADDDDDEDLARAKKFASYAANEATIKYRSLTGMAQSVFRRKNQGHFANKRLRTLYDIVYGGASAAGVRMICSEFAASCYEVAALKIEEDSGTNPLPFGSGVDPRALTAKALEAMLERPNSRFSLAGRYAGSEPLEQNELAIVQRLASLYVTLCKEVDMRLSVEEAYDAIQADRSRWVANKLDIPTLGHWSKYIAKAYDLRIIGVPPPAAAPGKGR